MSSIGTQSFFCLQKLGDFLEDKMMTDIVVLRNGSTSLIRTKCLHDVKQITSARLLQAVLQTGVSCCWQTAIEVNILSNLV